MWACLSPGLWASYGLGLGTGPLTSSASEGIGFPLCPRASFEESEMAKSSEATWLMMKC